MRSNSISSASAPSSLRRFVGIGVLLGALLFAGQAFAAKKRVVVLGFSGPQAGQAEAAVAAAVKKKSTVVSTGQYAKAQKRLKIKKQSAKNVAKIAAEIQVDAVISGAIKRKGTKWSLTVTVREGRSGKVRGTATIPLRASRIDARAKQDIASRVPPIVAKTKPVSGGGGGGDEEEEEEDESEAMAEGDDEAGGDGEDAATDEEEVAMDDEGDGGDDEAVEEDETPKKKGKKATAKEKAAKEKAAREKAELAAAAKTKAGKRVARRSASDEEEEAAGDGESADEGDGEAAAAEDDDEPIPGIDGEEVAARGEGDDEDGGGSSVRKSSDVDGDGFAGGREDRFARHAAFDLTVGVSAVGRSLSFTTRSGLPMNQLPNGYEGSIVPGGMVAVELYPLGFGKAKGGLAGLGLTANFDRVFVLKSRYGAMEFNTTQQRLGVGLHYRLNIGDKATSPSFNFGVGYNQLSFVIDSGATTIGLPDVVYTYLDPGAGARIPLGKRLAVNADARFLLVMATGEFGNNQNYGKATVIGVDADVGLEYRVTTRLPVRLGARYQRLAFDFTGSTGDKVVNLDGDATSQDVGGALDQFLGAYLSLGYLF